MMKRFICAGLMMGFVALPLCSALAQGSGAKSGYQMPSDDVIKSIISEPERISGVLEGANESDVSSILIKAIGIMESMEMQEDMIAAKLNTMLNTISEVRGEAFGAAVLARIRKKVNPRLLPVVPPGGTTPSGGSRYPRQSSS